LTALGLGQRSHRLQRLPLPDRVREAIALTISAQIGTWPLSAAIFSTLAPYAVLANAVVVPLIVVALPGGLAALLFAPVAGLETQVLRAVEGTVRTIAAFPGARATIGTPPLWAILGYDALALGSAALLRSARPAFAVVALVAGSALVFASATVRLPHGLEITSLDVGQGDGAVIRTPHDRIILIDTGGELEHGNGPTSNAEAAGARVVLAYLRRTGITQVDLMLLTHPHGDHVGGCAPIIDAIPVRMIFDSGQQYDGRAFRDCIREAATHGVPVLRPQRGDRWSDDGVTLDILAPSLPLLADTGDDINENSIVARLTYADESGPFRELFMGDAGNASEARLLASGIDLHANVLKVGHHGSRYASTRGFIATVRPSIAVVSVGRHNTFGHPALSTLATLRSNSTSIYRTDQCGAVSLQGSLNISTMLNCREQSNGNGI
jgi:competence protein ComEC